MDLYFFLDSKIFEPAITVSSFPPSGLLPDRLTTSLFICFAYPKGDYWIVETYQQMSDYASLTILASDLNVPREHISSTLVFLSSEKMDGVYSEFPQTYGLESRPSWRANLKIFGDGTSVSYQGELPFTMTKIKGGSIISLVPFIQDAPTIKNYLFFVAFGSSPLERKGSIEFKNIQSRQTLAKYDIQSNKVNCIDLSDIKLGCEQLLSVAKGVIGIPVFFSVDENGRKMSLEHTMTPSEYSIYGEQDVKKSLMQRMKTYWS